MAKIIQLLGRYAGKVWSTKHKRKRHKSSAGKSTYEVRIPKSISRRLRRKKKF